MDPGLEIRKLPINIRSELIKLLEMQEAWKKLMAIIPQTLILNEFQSDITSENPAKYRSEHFYIIEDASLKKRLFCAEILLREWGTSGRVRPALGHLRYLLEKAELFRAAEYITVQVLNQAPPIRPKKGPAAPVEFNSGELEDSDVKRIEKILDEIDYPSSAIANINKLNSIDTNLNYSSKEAPKMIPKIIISESPNVEELKPSFNVPLVVPKEKTDSETNSDMMKFSTGTISDDDNTNVPKLTELLTEQSFSNIPVVLDDIGSDDSSNIPAVIGNDTDDFSSETNRPHLSSLMSSSNNSESNFNVPALSDLNLSSCDSSSNVPALSQLLDSEQSSTKIRSCPSPLPILSLNTPLPHFTYYELESATNNFDETPVSQGGRFLGSGAFGKVYLADSLLSKPVAVKKVLLDNVDVVKVDDTVTKQFKNEVEILSKYKHENLVALLGYSCDGLTYCMLYEFVPGGALKDHLQKRKLIWTVRFYIALGTARAIAYLHTAYSTPLIHRDVKSANILLDVTNKPKLCDFGLIKHALNQNTLAATTIFGTSAYMAHEAFRGDISVKLDTFSFGVVLLELLTSLPPVDENREGVDLTTHVQEHCPNEIAPLLDTLVGSWTANNIKFGQELYDLAQNCLKEKKHERPLMTAVCSTLGELVKKSV